MAQPPGGTVSIAIPIDAHFDLRDVQLLANGPGSCTGGAIVAGDVLAMFSANGQASCTISFNIAIHLDAEAGALGSLLPSIPVGTAPDPALVTALAPDAPIGVFGQSTYHALPGHTTTAECSITFEQNHPGGIRHEWRRKRSGVAATEYGHEQAGRASLVSVLLALVMLLLGGAVIAGWRSQRR